MSRGLKAWDKNLNSSSLFHREGNGSPLQYSCLENPMGRGAWKAAVHGVAKSRTLLSDFTLTFMHWRRKWQPTPVFLPGESQGRGAWWAAVYGVAQSRTQLKRLSSSSRSLFQGASQMVLVVNNLAANTKYKRCRFNPWVGEDPLEENMATHSSVLAWRIPWTEEPGGLHSIGLQRDTTEATNHTHSLFQRWFRETSIWSGEVKKE